MFREFCYEVPLIQYLPALPMCLNPCLLINACCIFYNGSKRSCENVNSLLVMSNDLDDVYVVLFTWQYGYDVTFTLIWHLMQPKGLTAPMFTGIQRTVVFL